MDTPISKLDLDELADMYEYLRLVRNRKSKEHPKNFGEWVHRYLIVSEVKIDMARIFEAMEKKVPRSHEYEIYKLEQEMKDKAERQRKIIEHIQRQNRKEIRRDLILTFFLTIALIATFCVMLYIGDDVNRSLKSLLQNLFK